MLLFLPFPSFMYLRLFSFLFSCLSAERPPLSCRRLQPTCKLPAGYGPNCPACEIKPGPTRANATSSSKTTKMHRLQVAGNNHAHGQEAYPAQKNNTTPSDHRNSPTTAPEHLDDSASSSTRDPDLPRSSSVPPPLWLPSSPVSISTSTSSLLSHEALNSFAGLTRFHSDSSSLDQDCSHCAHNSTFYHDLSPTTYHNRHTTSFFDPTPSSAGASPRTPHHPTSRRQSLDPMAARQLLTPEPAENATYWNSAVGYHLTMKNAQWRPQSAPKPTHPRSASPLAFWNKRGGTSGGHHQLRDDESDEAWPRMGTATSRDDGDHMLIDTVSNHLGRLAPPSPSSSMDSKSKDRDLRISTKKAPTINCEPKFGQGPPPIITKAEYDALPLAIQRKVRCKSVFLVGLRLTRCPIPNCHFRSAFRHVELTRNPGFIFASPAWKPFPPFERDWHFFPCIPVHPACFFLLLFFLRPSGPAPMCMSSFQKTGIQWEATKALVPCIDAQRGRAVTSCGGGDWPSGPSALPRQSAWEQDSISPKWRSPQRQTPFRARKTAVSRGQLHPPNHERRSTQGPMTVNCQKKHASRSPRGTRKREKDATFWRSILELV